MQQLWQSMGAYSFPEEMMPRTFSFALMYDMGPNNPPGAGQGVLSKSELQQCLNTHNLKVQKPQAVKP